MKKTIIEASISPLKQTLGLSFGLAVMVGSIIGVGILRTPGTVAGMLQDPLLIMAVWALGGLYVLLAIGSLAELATMIPQTGGIFIYAQRAFGEYIGFAIGWLSFFSNTVAPAFFSIVIGEYVVLLLPQLAPYQTGVAMGVLILFTLFHLTGIDNGSLAQQITSLLKVVALLILIIFCFFSENQLASTPPQINANDALESSLWIAFFPAFQLVSGTYNGFAAPVLFAEEDTKPSQNIPKSLYGGALIVIAVYLLINLATLYVLPVSVLQDSKLALAEVATVVLGEWGARLIILIALLSLLSILNAYLMIAPRILFGLSRAGFFSTKGLIVNRKGTPSVVLLFTCLLGLCFIYVGSFEQLYNFSALIEILVTLFLFASVIRLRITEPDLPRPHRAWAYPLVPVMMIFVSIGFLAGFIYNDFNNSALLLIICLLTVPAYFLISYRKKANTSYE
jgi:APA family basic amino acid/polyamine antiporter